jgi:hypothetical protein
MPIHWEEKFASLLAAGGLGWGVYLSTQNLTALDRLTLPMQPVYVCALGVVIWLHAKWRRSMARV